MKAFSDERRKQLSEVKTQLITTKMDTKFDLENKLDK